MQNEELIQALRLDAEWAHANEWETPITLGDHLDAAADALAAYEDLGPVEELAALRERTHAERDGRDAVSVQHGHWERISSKMVDGGDWWWDVAFKCSCCGDKQTYGKSKYCPNCGADMRGERKCD
jgi:hypothetical protein